MPRLIFMLIAVACIGMCAGVVLAQGNAVDGGTLRGRITDTTEAQNPIEGVEIKIVAQDGTEFTTTTDANGDYKHTGLPAGRYLINISKEGVGERIGQPVVIVNGGDHFMPLKMSNKDVIILPPVHVQGKRMGVVVKERIQVLLQLIGDNLSIRYNLDHAVVKVLRQSVFEAVETAIKRDTDPHDFERAAEKSNTVLLEVLLSHPDCKNIFLEHLTETQLQDYIDSIKVRRQEDQQAVARLIARLIGRELSLTIAQYQHVEQLLLDTADNESFPISINILGIDFQETVNLIHYRLKVSLNGILSQTQSEIWQGLMKRGMDESDDNERIEVFVKTEVEIQKAVAAGKMTKQEAEIRLDALKDQLWSENDIAESQERTKQLAEAKLTAHTELLGPLDESASQRLKMAIKGAVQLNLEKQDQDTEKMLRNIEAELGQAVEAGKMTHEQAAAALTDMQRWLWVEKSTVRRSVQSADLTMHPLYQQTIKDVLSKDAFAEYTAREAGRVGFLKHASRDIVVLCLDAEMLLDDAQREKFQLIAAQLRFPSSSERPAMDMFSQFYRQADRGILNQWQRGEFERLYSTIRSEMK